MDGVEEAHDNLVDDIFMMRAEILRLRHILDYHGIDYQGPLRRQAARDWAEVMQHESTESEGDISDMEDIDEHVPVVGGAAVGGNIDEHVPVVGGAAVGGRAAEGS
jgi:hypothetical protein